LVGTAFFAFQEVFENLRAFGGYIRYGYLNFSTLLLVMGVMVPLGFFLEPIRSLSV
jgi:hypothetical protein